MFYVNVVYEQLNYMFKVLESSMDEDKPVSTTGIYPECAK
jgi:hypothetical protein